MPTAGFAGDARAARVGGPVPAAVLLAAAALLGSSVLAGDAAGQEGVASESVRGLLAAGRHWQASLELRAAFAEAESAVAVRDRVFLAEAEAGWRNWEGVVAALSSGEKGQREPPLEHWLLLGTALAETGGDEDAEAALARFLDAVAPRDPRRAPALSRWIRAGAARRPAAETEDALATLRSFAPVAADWTALEAARSLAATGRPEATRRVREHVRDRSVRRRGWSLVVDAWAAAGDTAAALAVLGEIAPAAAGPPSRVHLAARRWRYRLALADTVGAVASAADVVGTTTRGAAALAAAKALRAHGRDLDPAVLRRMASALGNGGEFGTAGLAWNAAVEAGAELSESERLSRARALAGSGARGDAIGQYRRLAESEDAETAARALSAWAGVRRRQGRHGDASTVEGWLVERFPSSRQALDVVFFRADDHQDSGRVLEALAGYRQVVAASPSADRAGLARMRWGQIHLARGEAEEALAVFDAYLAEFPEGRRWEEAAFWAAQAATEVGDTAFARARLARIRRESPLSYYAFLSAADGRDPGRPPGGADVSAALEGVLLPPRPTSLEGDAAPPPPSWLAREMDVLAMLDASGLHEAAAAHVERTRSAAEASAERLFALAVALRGAGRPRDAITLGWELRRRGRAWDLPLLRLVFPFPHRELVEARSAELGLDPHLVAGLIRQESAFDPERCRPPGRSASCRWCRPPARSSPAPRGRSGSTAAS